MSSLDSTEKQVKFSTRLYICFPRKRSRTVNLFSKVSGTYKVKNTNNVEKNINQAKKFLLSKSKKAIYLIEGSGFRHIPVDSNISKGIKQFLMVFKAPMPGVPKWGLSLKMLRASIRIPVPQIMKVPHFSGFHFFFCINWVFYHIQPKLTGLIHTLPTEFSQWLSEIMWERALKTTEHFIGFMYNYYSFPSKILMRPGIVDSIQFWGFR